MKPLMTMVALAGLSLALPACEYKPESKADLLTESGFKVLSLNTPAKAASFKKLPPHRLTLTTFKGKQVWVYPDRNVCGCLYVGSQTAYKTYIAKATQQMIDTRVNQMYDNNDPQPYDPATFTAANLNWDDPWDDSDAYGLYIN